MIWNKYVSHGGRSDKFESDRKHSFLERGFASAYPFGELRLLLRDRQKLSDVHNDDYGCKGLFSIRNVHAVKRDDPIRQSLPRVFSPPD
jgi:hypothetical protein